MSGISTQENVPEMRSPETRYAGFGSDGTENPYWNSGNCGPVAGESTNNWHANLDWTQLEVKP